MTTNKKFCTSTTNGSASVNSSNFLCEKCNNFQELKMIELKNFESKSDVSFCFCFLIIFNNKFDFYYIRINRKKNTICTRKSWIKFTIYVPYANKS